PSFLLSLCQQPPSPRALHSFPTRRSSDLPDQHRDREDRVDAERSPPVEPARIELDHARRERRLQRRALLVATALRRRRRSPELRDRKSTRLNSSHVKISYAVFCLKKKIHN